MTTNIVMPQLGESVVEGTVGKWLKQVGDKIEQYEPVMEVITDKVTTEIPSPAAGTLLQIAVPEGTIVKAGTVLAVIGAPGESPVSLPVPSPDRKEERITAPSEPTAQPCNKPTIQRLTPVVARMIAENHITNAELATIRGTGDGGRVNKKDIESFLKTRGAPKLEELPPWEQPGTGELFRPTEEIFGKSAALPPLSKPGAGRGGGEEIIPISPIRKSIAERMVRSKQIAPHVTTVHEADMGRVVAYQKANEAEFARQGVKLTYTAFFIKPPSPRSKRFRSSTRRTPSKAS